MSKEKFEAFATKYMDMIYRIAYSWMKNSHDANDITQEVLIRLYETDKAFESETHIKNWLIKVTINQCKMFFRSPWRNVEDVFQYAESIGVEDTCQLGLFSAVMKLDKKYRVPLMLFYYEGYSTKEVALFLGTNEKTISTRLYRAKNKLKEYLNEE